MSYSNTWFPSRWQLPEQGIARWVPCSRDGWGSIRKHQCGWPDILEEEALGKGRVAGRQLIHNSPETLLLDLR